RIWTGHAYAHLPTPRGNRPGRGRRRPPHGPPGEEIAGGNMGVRYDRAGAAIYRSKRWQSVRFLAKRRDGFKCVECGATGRIEVDHKLPIRTHPELAYDLGNLQC